MLRQLGALAVSCVVLIGPQIALLLLLNFRDRRQDRILGTIARDLSRLPGAVGCRVRCALFWPSSVVELHMWTCHPHEMWGTSLRVLERLPPGVRVVVEGPLSDQLVVSIGLVSRGRARPDPHGRDMLLDMANAAPAADGLGPRRAALAPARVWRLNGAGASSTGQADRHMSVSRAPKAREASMVNAFNPPGVWAPFGIFSMAVIQGPGQVVHLKGQVALDIEGHIVGKGDMRAQIRQTLENIQTVLASLGGTMKDILSLTHYVIDIDAFMAAGDVRRQFFVEPYPVTTTLQVARLYHPDLAVEITVIAEIPRERFQPPPARSTVSDEISGTSSCQSSLAHSQASGP